MPHFPRHVLIYVALLPLCASTACAAQLTERSLIRPVAAGELSDEAVRNVDPQLTVDRQTIVMSDGIRLYGVLLRRQGADVTILYFGGNQFTVGNVGAGAAQVLAPLNANLMMVDYRGYGLSEGSPTTATLLSDGLAVFDHLARLPEIGASKIVVHGQSLGSFVAGHVAATRPTAGVVLESSITTTEDWVSLMAGGRALKIAPELAGQGNRQNMALVDEPLLILVGANDRTTPPSLSEALYRQSPLPPARKTLSIVAGAGHNDVLIQPAAQATYRAFLDGV